jgi:hypothetical protein
MEVNGAAGKETATLKQMQITVEKGTNEEYIYDSGNEARVSELGGSQFCQNL